MGAQVEVDYASVLSGAERVSLVPGAVRATGVDTALRRAAAAVPGGAVDTVGRQEAAEWSREVGALGDVAERFARGMRAAVEAFRAVDRDLTR